MGSPGGLPEALSADWLGACRRAADAARGALAPFDSPQQRARETWRGEGGDMALAMDRAAEDAVLDELERLGVGARVVTEERGEVEIAGGGAVVVVVDPIDGSLNAKRDMPHHALSIAVASGNAMADVELGYVATLDRAAEEFWARRGAGAWLGGERLDLSRSRGELEVLGVESARPELVAAAAERLATSGARRLRMIGSIALSLCYVGAMRFDAMLSLRTCRSVDAAAAQLVVREAGGLVSFPDAGDLAAPLDLEMRSRVVAAPTPALLDAAAAAAG
ncbi:MAG TPA: inositol monophosphatase family protein [Thermoleophilaceae bacterium]|jgi:myo-inositol-1(or 4)-monophosphatase